MTPHQLRHAARILRRGGVIAYPTEGVWGLGCDPLDAAAVYRLLALKQRPVEKGLILIAQDFSALAPFVRPLTPEIEARLAPTWPGPVTWVLPARSGVPDWLTGGRDTLAVRVTAHPPAAALCQAWGGALVSTSANLAGHPAPRSRARLSPKIALNVSGIFPGRTGSLKTATRIRDARDGRELRAAS